MLTDPASAAAFLGLAEFFVVMKFYFSIDGSDVVGPHDARELQLLLEAGLLPTATRLCAEGTTAWKPLAEIVPANESLTKTATLPGPPGNGRALAIGGVSLALLLGLYSVSC